MNGLILRYYCRDEGNRMIRELLEKVKNELGISYEVIGGPIMS
jgi:hypothetical protein